MPSVMLGFSEKPAKRKLLEQLRLQINARHEPGVQRGYLTGVHARQIIGFLALQQTAGAGERKPDREFGRQLQVTAGEVHVRQFLNDDVVLGLCQQGGCLKKLVALENNVERQGVIYEVALQETDGTDFRREGRRCRSWKMPAGTSRS